jgi:hypothetical protein
VKLKFVKLKLLNCSINLCKIVSDVAYYQIAKTFTKKDSHLRTYNKRGMVAPTIHKDFTKEIIAFRHVDTSNCYTKVSSLAKGMRS